MKFLSPEYLLFGLVFFILWTINFWSIFKAPLLYFRSVQKKRNLRDKILKKIIYIIGAIGILLITYASMNPSINVGYKQSNIYVNDIYFVVDVSQSMLAIDFKPNRIEVAKNNIKEFISLRPTDRIGIVVFSDNVFTLMPLTIDNNLVLKSVNQISVGFLGSGTNIGDALALAIGRLKKTKVKNKFIILLTDGVSNTGMLTPVEAAKMAKQQNIKIYTVGIGKLKNGKYLSGGRNGYRNIPGGSIDLTTMNEISKSTNGKFFYAGNPLALKKILAKIQKLEKTKIKSSNNIIFNSKYYFYLLLGSLMFLFSEFSKNIFLREAM